MVVDGVATADPPRESTSAARSKAMLSARRTDTSVTGEVLMFRYRAVGVGPASLRASSAGSAWTAAICSDDTIAVITAVASSPALVRTRSVWSARDTVQSKDTTSGYWWRIGSLAGFQYGLRSST